MKKLTRSESNRKVAGVCSGIGQYLKLDPTIVRVVFVILTVMTSMFPMLVLYVMLMLLIPNESEVS